MAVENKKLSINIKIDGRIFPLEIDRDEEERYRKAAKMVNEIVEKEGLAKDYNIYVFHGTDGDDWDTEGKESIPEIEKMMAYAARIGVTIAENSYGTSGETEVEKYLKGSGLLESKKNLIRLDVMSESAEEPRIIQGIKTLISE